MVRDAKLSKRIRLVGILGLFGILTGLVLGSGTSKNGRPVLGYQDGGDARLISVQQLPEMDGEICLLPASATTSLAAALSQQPQSGAVGAAGAAEPRPSDAVKEAGAKRAPVRTLQDPNPVYSGVALDLTNDEVVIQDENTYGILVYNRLDNTPPTARMTEPKRTIRGENTHLELNCGLYVDSGNGDIYSVNNDTLQLMTVFSRDARGNVSPKRMLKQPGSVYGIAVDEEAKELFLVVQGGQVVVYDKEAKNFDAPLRYIQGDQTRLANSHGMALDSKRGLLFVGNWGTSHQTRPPAAGDIPWGDGRRFGTGGGRVIPGSGKMEPPSITVYRKDAMGDVAPLRVIQGPKTQMNWPTALAVDPERGELFVANDTGHSVTVYNIEAHGDVAPLRVLQGPKTLIKNPSGVAYDAKHDELWISNFGNHAATVFKRTAAGDTAPLRIIRSAPLETPAPVLSNPHVVIYNPNRDELLVGT